MESKRIFDRKTFSSSLGSDVSENPVVLVVDDDHDQLMLFKTLFEQAGYNVIPACTAYEALTNLDQIHVDIVVCDVMMPQIDGKEFTKLARKKSGLNNLPIVFMSANSEFVEKDLLETGANAFYPKTRIRSLIGSVNKLIEESSESASLLDKIQDRFGE